MPPPVLDGNVEGMLKYIQMSSILFDTEIIKEIIKMCVCLSNSSQIRLAVFSNCLFFLSVLVFKTKSLQGFHYVGQAGLLELRVPLLLLLLF